MGQGHGEGRTAARPPGQRVCRCGVSPGGDRTVPDPASPWGHSAARVVVQDAHRVRGPRHSDVRSTPASHGPLPVSASPTQTAVSHRADAQPGHGHTFPRQPLQSPSSELHGVLEPPLVHRLLHVLGLCGVTRGGRVRVSTSSRLGQHSSGPPPGPTGQRPGVCTSTPGCRRPTSTGSEGHACHHLACATSPNRTG